MSTEERGARSVKNSSFGRTLAVMIIVLATVCAGLAVLTLGQGPRLARADIDTDSVVELADQRLLLHSTESLAEVEGEQVSISPSVPVRVATDGSTVALTFDQRLLYNTDYVVSITGVTSPFQAADSTFEYSFTTGSPPIYYVQRAAPGETDDKVMRTTVSGSSRDVVYSAPRIQDFAVVGSSLAIATTADDGSSALSLVVPGQSAVETLPLPARGTITQLGSSVKQAMLGFRFTSDDPAAGYNDTLLLFDLLAKHASFTLPGTVIGEPLHVDEWRFIPDSTLVETAADGVLSIYDSALQQGAVIGDYDSLGEIAPGGTKAVIGKLGEANVLDLLSGDVEPLVAPLPEGTTALGLPLLGADGESTVTVASQTTPSGESRQVLVRSDDRGASTIFSTDTADARIVSVVQSPNTQYLAVEVAPRGADGTVTSLVDRSTGQIVRTLDGIHVTWP